jgi:MioC protein
MSRLRVTVDALYFRCGTYNSANRDARKNAGLRGTPTRMAVEITILVGTMTGTADMVAQEVQQALESAGHTVEILQMDGLDAAVFRAGGTFLICTSTYGAGDVPDNAQQFFSSLETEKPKLDNVIYGVIALGDTTYKDTFCQGGKRFDQLLTELGGRRAGEMLMHDASSGTLPEELAAQWVVAWVQENVTAARQAPGVLSEKA